MDISIQLLLKVNHLTTLCAAENLIYTQDLKAKPEIVCAILYQNKDRPGYKYRGLCFQSEEKSSRSEDSLTSHKNKTCL